MDATLQIDTMPCPRLMPRKSYKLREGDLLGTCMNYCIIVCNFSDATVDYCGQLWTALRLKHSHGSGDPDCLEGALQEAQDHGLDEEHLVPAQADRSRMLSC